MDNLTLGMSMPKQDEIYTALSKTGLLKAVQQHPQGLQLPIHEGGFGLSGGQKQLVGLTRMVLQNPKIWLLDEPSASLDGEVESRITSLIRGLSSETTVIFSTHRKSWVALSDRILHLEDGRIKSDTPSSSLTGAMTTTNIKTQSSAAPASQGAK